MTSIANIVNLESKKAVEFEKKNVNNIMKGGQFRSYLEELG